ncbi:MAG: hypothetical protein WCI55_13525 [Armatimonadota bacterium]
MKKIISKIAAISIVGLSAYIYAGPCTNGGTYLGMFKVEYCLGGSQDCSPNKKLWKWEKYCAYWCCNMWTGGEFVALDACGPLEIVEDYCCDTANTTGTIPGAQPSCAPA